MEGGQWTQAALECPHHFLGRKQPPSAAGPRGPGYQALSGQGLGVKNKQKNLEQSSPPGQAGTVPRVRTCNPDRKVGKGGPGRKAEPWSKEAGVLVQMRWLKKRNVLRGGRSRRVEGVQTCTEMGRSQERWPGRKGPEGASGGPALAQGSSRQQGQRGGHWGVGSKPRRGYPGNRKGE